MMKITHAIWTPFGPLLTRTVLKMSVIAIILTRSEILAIFINQTLGRNLIKKKIPDQKDESLDNQNCDHVYTGPGVPDSGLHPHACGKEGQLGER